MSDEPARWMEALKLGYLTKSELRLLRCGLGYKIGSEHGAAGAIVMFGQKLEECARNLDSPEIAKK